MKENTSNAKIGVHVSVYFNQASNILEVKLSNQVKRHFIGPIDSIVDRIAEAAPLRRRFCSDPKGEFLGEDTVRIPFYGLWTEEDKKQAMKNRPVRPQKTTATPTSVWANAKIVKTK